MDEVKNTLSASWFYKNYLDQHKKLKRTENEQNESMCSVQISYSIATYLVLGSEFICSRPHLLDGMGHLLDDRKNWRCYVGLHKIWGKFAHGAHSANFDEKVHKPQSKFYGRIGENMQLIFTHMYLMNLNTSISASQLFGVWGTPRDPYWCIKSI